jgi:hypothetical protein
VDKELLPLSHLFELPSKLIAGIYQDRWAIESFLNREPEPDRKVISWDF